MSTLKYQLLAITTFLFIIRNNNACFSPGWDVVHINSTYQFINQISAASDGTLYGVAKDEKIYRYNGERSWSFVNGRLVKISVGSTDLIYGVHSTGKVYKLNDDKDSWTPIPFNGIVSDISVGSGGAVFVIDSRDYIYRLHPDGSSWIQVPGMLVQIDVTGSPNHWAAMGVNMHGQVYHRRYWDSSWRQLPGHLTQLSYTEDYSVYGFNDNSDNHDMWQLKYAPSTATNSWERICGWLSLTSVTVVNKNLFYATISGNVVRSKSVYVPPPITPSPTTAYGNDGCSWIFDVALHSWGCKKGVHHNSASDCPADMYVNYCQTGCSKGGCPSGWNEVHPGDDNNCGMGFYFYNNELCYRVGSAHSEISNMLNQLNENNQETVSYYMYVIEMNIATSIIVTLLCITILVWIYKFNCCKIRSRSKSDGFAVISSIDDSEVNEEVDQVYDVENK
eukprot:26275_1